MKSVALKYTSVTQKKHVVGDNRLITKIIILLSGILAKIYRFPENY